MIKEITWKEIEKIWKLHLWPHRTSPIEPRSAMMWKQGHNLYNMTAPVVYLGFYDNKKIVAVNSGHNCFSETCDEMDFRSRGLWVHPKCRGRGIGQALLKATIDKGFELGNSLIWSYPRETSWPTYAAVGFNLDTDWAASENGRNAFCSLKKIN